MTDRELMQMALFALDLWKDALTDPCADYAMRYRSFGEDATKALRERLSQPKQEPVAWLSKYTNDDNKTIGYTLWKKDVGEGCFPVYAAPPKREWVGLTDEEILEIPFLELVEGIQAKLKEKNGG